MIEIPMLEEPWEETDRQRHREREKRGDITTSKLKPILPLGLFLKPESTSSGLE